MCVVGGDGRRKEKWDARVLVGHPPIGAEACLAKP